MAVSQTTLKALKTMYWLVTVGILLFTCYTLLKMDRAISAIIFLFLGLMLIYVMYPVFFPAGDPGSHWPPYISACPDYLSVLVPGKCVDYVGLGSSQLKKSNPAHPPAPTETDHVFDSTGTTAQKIARAQQYGLSWEGLF
jgi:hypothetical protein